MATESSLGEVRGFRPDLDLTTVNELSDDLRVFLNLADGTGNYGSFLAPVPTGTEPSPNEPADFDNDGDTDLCVTAWVSRDVRVFLGNGDGTFQPGQAIRVGSTPLGIATLDVDGDADFDIVNANLGCDDLCLIIWTSRARWCSSAIRRPPGTRVLRAALQGATPRPPETPHPARPSPRLGRADPRTAWTSGELHPRGYTAGARGRAAARPLNPQDSQP